MIDPRTQTEWSNLSISPLLICCGQRLNRVTSLIYRSQPIWLRWDYGRFYTVLILPFPTCMGYRQMRWFGFNVIENDISVIYLTVHIWYVQVDYRRRLTYGRASTPQTFRGFCSASTRSFTHFTSLHFFTILFFTLCISFECHGWFH